MKVLLLNMPFVSVSRPAMGLSLLKARLDQEGIDCRIGYANLYFAERAGLDEYIFVDEKLSLALFAGDWLFAQHVWGESMDTATYLATVEHYCNNDVDYQKLVRLRDEIGPFLEGCFERFDIASYDVIGFTSTFQQNLASLTLARMIRERYPEKVIVFGGGNCEGVMGLQLQRSFPWIDYVFSGESDNSFPLFLKRLEAGEPLTGIPGLIARVDGVPAQLAPADKIHNMDAMPDPDFDEYFEAVRSGPYESKLQPQVLIETARGCWWGAKQHCTFCGLNGETMVFRAKTAERVIGEIERQLQRYGVRHFQAVDNIISHDYFRTLLPMLKERKLGVSFFYEIKSNMRRDQIQLMREAGIVAVQPGIESLSSHVLKLMRKGVTGIQNVQLLKWCREYGIEVAWNLLYGFPGETAEDYEEIARYASAIPHLKPPGTVAPIRLDRFSPNFTQADHFGIVQVRPFSMYKYVYPLPEADVANLAYFFEYAYHDGRDPSKYTEAVKEQIKAWQQNTGGSLYKDYERPGAEMTIVDTRPGRSQMLYPFRGVQRELYEYCEEVRSRQSIVEFARSRAGDSSELESSVDAFLASMEKWQLMIREGQQYLSVALSLQGARQQFAAAA